MPRSVSKSKQKKTEMEKRWKEWGDHEDFPTVTLEDGLVVKEASHDVITTPKAIKAEDLKCIKEAKGSKYSEALKLVLEDNQKTMELLLKASKDRSTSEEERLDQENQRIKEIELEKLEEPTEESAAIV